MPPKRKKKIEGTNAVGKPPSKARILEEAAKNVLKKATNAVINKFASIAFSRLRSGRLREKTLGVEITVEDCNMDLYENAKKYPEDAKIFNENTILVYEPGRMASFQLMSGIKKFGFVGKIGHGQSSLVWMVVDFESKEFRALKLFRYDYNITQDEVNTLRKIQNHPNILRYYDSIDFKEKDPPSSGALYEPMGKSLLHLMEEKEKYGGISNGSIKIIAKNILNALKVLHDECKMIHTDIKPENIAACTTQKNLFDQIQNILKSKKSIKRLRMTFKQKTEDKGPKRRKKLKEYMDALQITETEEKVLQFKLIDFGDILEECNHTTIGSYGYRSPEYFFGADITYSYDVWALGITLIQLFTCQFFVPFCKNDWKNELQQVTNIFGKLPREWYVEFDDPHGFLKKFTTPKLTNIDDRVKKELQRRTENREMIDDEREKVNDFFFKMLHPNPSKRMSAADLLKHPWLSNDENMC